MAKKLDCEECRDLYRAYHTTDPAEPEHPPCGPPDAVRWSACPEMQTALMAENVTAWNVYRRVCNQHRMGQAGPVALDLVPSFQVMDRMGIDPGQQLEIADMVSRTYSAVIKELI